MKISVEDGFVAGLKKLPPDRAKAARNGLVKFARAPNLPHLYFRQLEGWPGYFIIDPRRGDRIILRRESDGHYVAVDVGPHDNVYRRWEAAIAYGDMEVLQLGETHSKDRARLEPASVDAFNGLRAALAVSLDSFHADFYRPFGGQSAPDAPNCDGLAVERIVEESALATIIDGRWYDAIGDLMDRRGSLVVSSTTLGAPQIVAMQGEDR